MKSLKGKLVAFLVVVFLIAVVGGYISFKYYDYVFSKRVAGEIVDVERVNTNETIITSGSAIPASQIFSFAVAIKDSQGEIHTASTEDRQWAVVQKGQCAEAMFYPYPPWDLNKAHTFHGARLIRLFDCPKPEGAKPEPPKPEAQAHPMATAPAPQAPPAAGAVPEQPAVPPPPQKPADPK